MCTGTVTGTDRHSLLKWFANGNLEGNGVTFEKILKEQCSTQQSGSFNEVSVQDYACQIVLITF